MMASPDWAIDVMHMNVAGTAGLLGVNAEGPAGHADDLLITGDASGDALCPHHQSDGCRSAYQRRLFTGRA